MNPYYERSGITIYHGDCREILSQLIGVQSIVTSPPYWSLRVYGQNGGVGHEAAPSEWVNSLVSTLSLAREVIAQRGQLWLNVGDSYAASGKGGGGTAGTRACWAGLHDRTGFRMPPPGFKMKDQTLAPFMLASALRDDGWYLRSTVVWRKPSATEPMRIDRPATSHEYVFQLTRSEVYDAYPGPAEWWGHSVWEITPSRDGVHPAAMPVLLAKRCIEASSRPFEVVLDPFAGSGTTLVAAREMGRRAIGIEIEERYCEIAAKRLAQGVLDFK